jgi:hypothetical protein
MEGFVFTERKIETPKRTEVEFDGDKKIIMTYNQTASFFINPEKTISYAVEQISDRKIKPVSLKYTKLAKRLCEEMGLFDYQNQKIYAYSLFQDETKMLTGNLGFDLINEFNGYPVLRLPDETFLEDENLLLINVNKKELESMFPKRADARNLSRVLAVHKKEIEEREVIRSDALVDKFLEDYQKLNFYLAKLL